jgi:hypothetical protein
MSSPVRNSKKQMVSASPPFDTGPSAQEQFEQLQSLDSVCIGKIERINTKMKLNLDSIGSILQSVEAESATSKLPIPSSGALKRPGAMRRLNRDLELSPSSCRVVGSGGSNMLTDSRRRTKN